MAVRPVYSTRLLAWSASSSPPPFTVPSGQVCIVRDADVYSGGGATITVHLGVNGVANFWAGQFTVESIPQVLQWRGRQVLNEGEQLVYAADGVTDGLVSGYLLLAP